MKFNHILFPTDFSERNGALKQRVEWLAGYFGSRVTLLHVFEIPAAWYGASEACFVNMDCFNDLRAAADQRLQEYAINVPEDRVQRITAEGDVAREIMSYASENEIDLIVMGTHGYGALQGWILGSVTAKVLHSAVCPVWTESPLHNPPENPAISNILCAIELVDEAVPLLQFTKQLAQDLRASVRLIHTVPELDTRPNRYFDFDLHQYLLESARVEIGKMQRQAGTEFPLTIGHSEVPSALSESAHENAVDVVVIGRGKAQKTFGRFQTHAYDIIRHAPCSVLSYSWNQQDHTSSSCNEEHLCQCEADAQLLTGSRKP